MHPIGRGIGVHHLFAHLPSVVLFVFGVLTQLGDPWFLFLVVTLWYLFATERVADDPRRSGAFLVALMISTTMVTVALKSLFGLPRPPGAATVTIPTWMPTLLGPLFTNLTTGTGYGFPSGHAVGSTAVYGGLALVLDVWSRRARAVAAISLVSIVALSRVALGVHYLVDLLIGIGVGLALLTLFTRIGVERTMRAFGVTAGFAGLALLVVLVMGVTPELRSAVSGAGGALGSLLAWWGFDLPAPSPSPVVGLTGLAAFGGLWVAAYALTPSLPVTFVANAAAIGGIVALPALVDWVKEKGSVPTQNVSR